MMMARPAAMSRQQTRGTGRGYAMRRWCSTQSRFNRTLRLLSHLPQPTVILSDLFLDAISTKARLLSRILALLGIAYNALFLNSCPEAKETTQQHGDEEETYQEPIHKTSNFSCLRQQRYTLFIILSLNPRNKFEKIGKIKLAATRTASYYIFNIRNC